MGNKDKEEGTSGTKTGPSLLDKAVSTFLGNLDSATKEQLRQLQEQQAVTINQAVLPAGLNATADNTSLSGILRSLLSTHEGPLAGLTENQLQTALSDLKAHSTAKHFAHVHAPGQFGSAELTTEDQAVWRNWARDSKNSMDLSSIFRFVCRFQQERNFKYSEKSLRENLYIICPREIMSSLNTKVDNNFPLQQIFNDLLVISDSVRSEEEIKLEVERILADPDDPIDALRQVLSLLEQCPNLDSQSLDSACLSEARRLIRRLDGNGGNHLYGSVEALFLHRPVKDFINYFHVLKSTYPQELRRLARPIKHHKFHHISPQSHIAKEPSDANVDNLVEVFSKFHDELKELKQTLVALPTNKPVIPKTLPPSHPTAQNTSSPINAHLLNRLTQLEDQQQQQLQQHRSLLMHHVPNPNIPAPYDQMPYNQRTCGIHLSRHFHSNAECAKQQLFPCPLPGHDHQASDCSQPRDYMHIPGIGIYNSHSATARRKCEEAGEVVQHRPRNPDNYDQPWPYWQQGSQRPVHYNTYGRNLPQAQQSTNVQPPLPEPSNNRQIDLPSTSTSTTPRMNHIPTYSAHETLPTLGNYLNF